MKILTNKVREFRFRNEEMTQQELADRIDVSRQTIHAIEKGKFNPSVRLALKIARVFQVPVEDIFDLEKEQGRR